MNDFSPSSVHIDDDLDSGVITFEVPLSELSRSLLKLERIFRETKRHIRMDTPSAHFFALNQLFKLLDFFERGDTKGQLIKELDRQISHFAKLGSNPEVDLSKLNIFINQLGQLSKWSKSQRGKIGHQLLAIEFLANARQKLSIGTTHLSFDAPFVKLFLAKPVEVRQEKLELWLKAFKGIQTSVEVLLRLSRETGISDTVFAEDGFYQEQMEKNQHQFIGICVPTKLNIYPEVSSGPKRFSIRFMALSDELESIPYTDNFIFELVKYN